MHAGQWRLSQGLRYWRSDRHFVLDQEQFERSQEHSEVVNTIGLLDTGMAYAFDDRLSFQVTMPLQAAQRSMPVRDASRVTVDRDVSTANAPGDLGMGFRYWVVDPAPDQPANLELGLGIKLPTGPTGLTGTRRSWDATTGTFKTTVQNLDQSIMPGDGGFGVMVQASGYWDLPLGVSGYLDGAYLLNPMDNSGIATGRSRPSEAFMTIADQYLLRLGVGGAVPWLPGLGVSLGGRWDGVPVRDLVGTSEWFRRPGYTISADPGVSYAWGSQSVYLNVPIALYRTRLQSVTDIKDGTNGDAAFADYMLSAGYTITFGPQEPAE
jgi:hypothetical protein